MAIHAHSISASSAQAHVLDALALSDLSALPRSTLERAIEVMIWALDLVDGDPDLEDNFDLEAVCEDEGADADFEPSLSRIETGFGASQHHCGASAADDDGEVDSPEFAS